MTSFVFQSALDKMLEGDIQIGNDTFYMMLVGSGYTPDKAAHDFRDDVTNEITGTGYTAGGQECTVSKARNDGASPPNVTITIDQEQWTGITIDGSGAAGAVVYKNRGGAAAADELFSFIDFGGDVDAAGGSFTAQASTIAVNNASV